MPRLANSCIANMEGMAALPRKSGELVFHDEWERRVFALAVAVCERSLYKWDDFRDRLIIEIATAERAEGTDVTAFPLPTYYENWLAALEKILIEKEICTSEQVKAKTPK